MAYKYAPYSYSKLNLFERCPFAWKLHYIDKIPETKTPALIVGDLVHRTIAEYLGHLKETGRETDLGQLKRIIPKYTCLSGQYSDEYEVYVPSMEAITLPPVDRVAIEAEVAVDAGWQGCDYWAEVAFLRGKVDLLYQPDTVSIVVVDWKTNRYLPNNGVIERDLQTRVYALLASLFVPEADEFVVELFFLRHGEPRRTTVTRDDLEKTKQWVVETARRIEAEEQWSPTPGFHCDWCSYVQRCPAAKQALETEHVPLAIATEKEAKKFTELYKMLGVVRNCIGEMLNAWVENHGGIEISGEKLDLYPVETVKWESPEQKGQLARILGEAGVPKEKIWDVFSANKTAVQRFLRQAKRKDLIEQALASGKRSVYTRFDFKKL